MSTQSSSLSPYVPPHSIDVEQALLGALLTERQAITVLIDRLRPDFFYKKAHQDIYRAIEALVVEEAAVDVLTVAERLKQSKQLSSVGGSAYLAQLSAQLSSSVHVEAYAELLIDYSMRRSLIDLSLRMRNDAQKGEEGVRTLLDTYEQSLFALGQNFLSGDYADLGEIARDMFTRLKEVDASNQGGLTGVASGFRALDRITGGWQRGDLIILAARPSMGRTAFAMNLLRNAALDFGVPVAFFSLEMSALQLTERLVVSEAGIQRESLRRGTPSQEVMEQLAGDRVQELLKAPIFIDDAAAMSIMDLRAKARRICSKHNVGLLAVDYLQLMRGERLGSQGNREQEIASISRMLKALAKELNIPVIAVSQLSRQTEQRHVKRPQLSDIRESGAIEQDADLVAFLYRPEYYGITADEEGHSTKGRTELIIAKHRNGPIGDINLHFDAEHTRFGDAEDRPHLSDAQQYHTLPSRMNQSDSPERTPF